jgi:hypothetical protein
MTVRVHPQLSDATAVSPHPHCAPTWDAASNSAIAGSENSALRNI